MCWKSKLSLKPFVGALQYFLIHRCGLDFCFRDPTVFWKSVHCSGRPYLYDGVIEISVRQPEGARIVKSTGRIVLGGSRWKVWRSCRKSHIRGHSMHFGWGDDLLERRIPWGCWWCWWMLEKSARLPGYHPVLWEAANTEHHQRVHHGQDMSTVGRSRILMVIGEEQETPIRIAISSRRTNRQRKAPHANRTSEDTTFQDVNLEIQMFSCQNVLETAPWERAKVGENRKGRDVRSWGVPDAFSACCLVAFLLQSCSGSHGAYSH